MARELLLDKWSVGPQLGSGGFGNVYEVTADGVRAAAKLVPKAPGADRELLFVDLDGVRNVVPVFEYGETEDEWVIIMARAERSLRDELVGLGTLRVAHAVQVFRDICEALMDLDGRIVHRDLKPENVLLVNAKWCLADFGISRYAEATTAPDTQKYALSAPYAAPERWRAERATIAADVYAAGLMAYEMLRGSRPFNGSFEELREQHLHQDAPHLADVPAPLAALIDECLYKAAQARPRPANVLERLERMTQAPSAGGLAALEEANRAEVQRRSEESRRASAAQSESERRSVLFDAADKSLDRVGGALRDSIQAAAPAVTRAGGQRDGWQLRLGTAKLEFEGIGLPGDWGGWEAPSFDVIAVSSLGVAIPPNSMDWDGRAHSLWFCDAAAEGEFSWFETAFMVSPLMGRRMRTNPFALDPGEESAKALSAGMAEFQLAWPFTPLVVGDLDEFVDRWAGWFAAASTGQLQYPSSMPERNAQGTWRR